MEKIDNYINMNDQSSLGTPAIISPRKNQVNETGGSTPANIEQQN